MRIRIPVHAEENKPTMVCCWNSLVHIIQMRFGEKQLSSISPPVRAYRSSAIFLTVFSFRRNFTMSKCLSLVIYAIYQVGNKSHPTSPLTDQTMILSEGGGDKESFCRPFFRPHKENMSGVALPRRPSNASSLPVGGRIPRPANHSPAWANNEPSVLG